MLVVGSVVFSLRECKGRVDVDVFMCRETAAQDGVEQKKSRQLDSQRRSMVRAKKCV